MKEKSQQYITKRLGRKPDNIHLVLEAFKPIKTKKDQTLVEVGDVCRSCYFIVNGCLKITTYNINGDESTTSLAFEEEWRTAMSSFINQQPSNERIVAVEKSEISAISRHEFQQFSQQINGF